MPSESTSPKPWSIEDNDTLRALVKENVSLDTIAAKLDRDFSDVFERLAHLIGQTDPFDEDSLDVR